jgi:type IV secretion system protein VirB8
MMTSGNPDNPLSRYSRSTVVQAHVESVSPVAADTALVRFYTEQSDPDQGPRPRAFWAAMVRYRFSGEPMTLADRLVNPLGFQVVSYRRDQEAPPPEPIPVATASPLPASPPLYNGAPVATPAPTGAPNQSQPAYPRPAGQAGRPNVIQTL